MHNDEQINKIEMDRKDLGMIHPAVYIKAECNKRPPQSTANKAIDKRGLFKKILKQETSPL